MGKHILVIDDDLGIREMLEAILDFEGYGVTVVPGGIEALQRIEAKLPDLIILDIMMPIMDGYAVAAELERRGYRPTIPVLALTADGRAAQKAAEIGAEDFLAKPFIMEDLLKKIQNLIQK
ncbi:MAG: response regulator transcription factor [Chloroflexaceae bacterium]|nr:response regulator transcription factor [Chloroflexaceae bacterium]NJL34705.1 response regulator transcription factor [Chloroflexaceae bacterium]NJO05514.1 response regulator transcription factor [Chloroflexaceae bacterium]